MRRGPALACLLLLVAVAVLIPRVSSSAAGGGPGAGAPAAARSASSPGYAFSSTVGGKPLRWPCEPVRWTVNLAGAPRGALAVLRSAVAQVAAASGTEWSYVGPTTTRPTSAVLPRTAQEVYPPVVLGWTDASSDLLRGQPSEVLAITRTTWAGVRRPDGSGNAALRTAVVAFDRTEDLPLRGPVSWETVALHELGHALGLAHVDDPRQLMADVMPADVSVLQPGDRAGLARVGPRAGCPRLPS